jgi:hypothetical protein
MKSFHGIFILMWLTGAFMPQFVIAESELDVAAKITGVTLAEDRRLNSGEEIKKSDGSKNKFLVAAKRHQLEFAELLGLAQAIKQQLDSANTYAAPQQRKEVVDELLKKNAALQIQAMRYVQALEKSRRYLLAGYRPVSGRPQDWEGRMCNDKQECIKLDPITALFTIASAQAGQ